MIHYANPEETVFVGACFEFHFGAYGDTIVRVYQRPDCLDDALETAAEWLLENERGQFVEPDYEAAQAELGETGEYSEAVTQAAETDLTYTESGYLASWEWSVTELDADPLVGAVWPARGCTGALQRARRGGLIRVMAEATLVTLHAPDAAKLALVVDEMRALGSPTLRAVDAGEGIYYLLEGTHRANAAAELGLPVVLDLVEYDWIDADADMRLCDWIPGLDCDSTIGSVIGTGATSDRCVDVEVEVET